MLLVLALIAGVTAMTAFAIGGGFTGLQLRNSAKELAAQLRYARAQAIATSTPQRFTLEVRAHRWQGSVGRHGAIPDSLSLSFIGGRQAQAVTDVGAVLFFPDGGSSGGRIEVAAKDQRWRIDVAWLTGEVTLSRADPEPAR